MLLGGTDTRAFIRYWAFMGFSSAGAFSSTTPLMFTVRLGVFLSLIPISEPTRPY